MESPGLLAVHAPFSKDDSTPLTVSRTARRLLGPYRFSPIFTGIFFKNKVRKRLLRQIIFQVYVVVVVLDFVEIRPREELLHSKCTTIQPGSHLYPILRDTIHLEDNKLERHIWSNVSKRYQNKYRASIEQVVQRSKT